MNPELAHALIPGTDEDVARRYATLSERARTQRFGLIEPEYVVLDTETTGFVPGQDALIEIAAAIISGPQIRARFSTFVNPQRPIPELITELTGIHDEDVCDAPLAAEALESLAEFAGGRRIIAHNASFDQEFIMVNARKSSKLKRLMTNNRDEGPEDYLGLDFEDAFGLDAEVAIDQDNPDVSWQGTGDIPPLLSRDPWIDTVELARIALPRFRVHNLETLSTSFCPERPSTHRALDDVEALCHVWRVLLVALHDLPLGLPHLISQLFEGTRWGARDILRIIAFDQAMVHGKSEAKDLHFSLGSVRGERMRTLTKQEKIDAQELDGGILALKRLCNDELEHAYTGAGLAGMMYPEYEPRAEQVEMACEVAEAFNSSTHRAIEAGTGVGKSMAYLLPLALFAKRNRVICGVATKTNALLDQLIYHELPRLATALGAQEAGEMNPTVGVPEESRDGALEESGQATVGAAEYGAPGALSGNQKSGLQYIALKGYDHYPCLRKLMRFSAQEHRFATTAPIILVSQLLSYVSQSSTGDIDPLPLRWQGVSRFEVCASADDCLRNKCRYYGSCLLHGARRQAAYADIVVTNHALLFCDHLFEGAILPPISHWVIDEAHSAESEARRQLTVQVEARGL
ncbi:MAG: exonuclease domain-containing protein, partial [Coriobacteriia bacterium]|nr:exonuclease domain-containing protein [Coriobacteriia bacterium]